ncbi:MAG: hypothetical protein QXG00_04140 [Candidatus Woesearchaeota archaeon]
MTDKSKIYKEKFHQFLKSIDVITRVDIMNGMYYCYPEIICMHIFKKFATIEDLQLDLFCDNDNFNKIKLPFLSSKRYETLPSNIPALQIGKQDIEYGKIDEEKNKFTTNYSDIEYFYRAISIKEFSMEKRILNRIISPENEDNLELFSLNLYLSFSLAFIFIIFNDTANVVFESVNPEIKEVREEIYDYFVFMNILLNNNEYIENLKRLPITGSNIISK